MKRGGVGAPEVVIGDASPAAFVDGERWGPSPSVRRRRGCVELTDEMEWNGGIAFASMSATKRIRVNVTGEIPV